MRLIEQNYQNRRLILNNNSFHPTNATNSCIGFALIDDNKPQFPTTGNTAGHSRLNWSIMPCHPITSTCHTQINTNENTKEILVAVLSWCDQAQERNLYHELIWKEHKLEVSYSLIKHNWATKVRQYDLVGAFRHVCQKKIRIKDTKIKKVLQFA